MPSDTPLPRHAFADTPAELYSLVASELPNGAVFVVDRDLRYVLADGAELRAAGFTPADFVGKTVREAIPPEQVEQYEQDYRLLLGGGTLSRQHEVGNRHYHSRGIGLKGSDGQERFTLVVSYEITDRIRAEWRLRLLAELGAIDAGATDSAALLRAVNAALGKCLEPMSCLCFDIAAGGAAHVIDDTLDPLQPPPPVTELALSLLETDRLSRGECLCYYGGATNTVARRFGMASVLLHPVLREGRLAGMFVALSEAARDWDADDQKTIATVSEWTWAGIERRRAIDAMRASEQRKEHVLAVLGHELRTPLATLTAGISVLGHQVAGQATQDTVALLRRQITQLSAMVDDLLGLSYLSHGKLQVRRDRCDLHELLRNVVKALAPAFERKKQRVDFDAPGWPFPIEGDVSKLTQVFTNLVDNAHKYTPAGGTIGITIEPRAGMVQVHTRDDGIGMAAEDIPYLFDLFTRVEDRRVQRSAVGGLGIGLWVAQQMVEAHGGRIRVASEGVGRGSVFSVELPVRLG